MCSDFVLPHEPNLVHKPEFDTYGLEEVYPLPGHVTDQRRKH